jgi:hypothetical protein
MRTLLLLFAFLFTVPGVVAAPQGTPTTYDIQRNCNSEASDTGDFQRSKAECVQAEDAAKKQLDQRWSTLRPSDATRQYLEESSIGGDQSYTELLTCLEMSDALPHDQTTVGR